MYPSHTYDRSAALAGLRTQREPAMGTPAAWQTDWVALLVIATVTAVAAGQLFYGGALIGQDSATQFYPWYDYLGERLQAGEIPGWNPYQFAGAPFAADPQSGWMYLPAMILFALLPVPFAVPSFLILHLLLAACATYALARALGIGVGGALVSAIAYQLSGPVLGRAVCCPAAFEVATWAPVALLGVELAVRRTDWFGRVAGWAIAGLALSQGLAAWLGQGAYYLLLALGAFVVYRTLLVPPDRFRRLPLRFADAALHGGAVLLIGFGLAAAGVLPRLDYVARSNVAGGEYQGEAAWAADIGGVTPSMVLGRMLDPSLHYPGAVVVTLAIIALIVARRWPVLPYFAGFGLCALVLATPWRTPLHSLLYALLPRFEALHQHWPERIGVVGYLCFAILAGAAVDALARDSSQRQRVLSSVGITVAVAVLLLAVEADVALVAVGWITVAIAFVLAVRYLGARSAQRVAPAALAAVVAVDLLLAFHGSAAQAPYGGFHRVDLGTYYAPSGAVAFLQERTADQPGRYLGFDPGQRAITDGQQVLYRFQFADAKTGALLVNNRATLHGIEDVQGYNPVQPQRFVEYLTALNGHAQEYHDANVYSSGVTSPLLDLLNVRYIVIPATTPDNRPDLQALDRTLPTVFADGRVKVLENSEALPRAWVVHDARQVGEGEALPLLTSREVDPRHTALIEAGLPPLAPAVVPEAEHVHMLPAGPDHHHIITHTDAPGLLVLSEAYDPGWRAYIDGEPAPVLVANHLLQAVPLPAGDHEVELRYELPMLRTGLALSTATAGSVVLVLLVLGWRRYRA